MARMISCLKRKEDEESHHKTEEPHSLGEGESENSVGEKLLLERGVPGVADDERAEDTANTSSGTGRANCSGASTDVFGCLVNVPSDRTGLDLARLQARETSVGCQ